MRQVQTFFGAHAPESTAYWGSPRPAKTARSVSTLAWWHPVEPNDVQRGIDLFETHSELNARDAVFAALAINRGIDAILATDRAFDGIDGLERIDPADERAVASLLD